MKVWKFEKQKAKSGDCFWFYFSNKLKTTVMRPKQQYSRQWYGLQISTQVSWSTHLLSQAIKGNSKQRCRLAWKHKECASISIWQPFLPSCLKSFHRRDIRLILQLSCIQKVAPTEICVKNKQTKTHLHLQLKNIRQLCMAVLSISNRCAFCECELLRSAQPHWFALFLNPHYHLPMKTRKKLAHDLTKTLAAYTDHVRGATNAESWHNAVVWTARVFQILKHFFICF